MKDNFDDILKKKWEHFHFEVDDQHRKDMIQLLDQSKRRRTGLFWWLSGSASILAVAILILVIKQPIASPQQLGASQPPAHSISHQDKAFNANDIGNSLSDDKRVNETNKSD